MNDKDIKSKEYKKGYAESKENELIKKLIKLIKKNLTIEGYIIILHICNIITLF
jgi:hypothetical protein